MEGMRMSVRMLKECLTIILKIDDMDKKSIKGTLTEQNLLKAFAGESQARNRYTIFAEVAREEGY